MRNMIRSAAIRRRAMTLVEVIVASTIALLVITTAIGSVVFYQKTVVKNDRAAKLANLMESQMELITNQTWYSLVNTTDGLFPPGGWSGTTRLETWPSRTGPFQRYEARTMALDLVKDAKLNTNYTGLGGKVEVFYTPFIISHRATNKEGLTVYFDVRYYKVELIVSLDQNSRVRPGTGPDVWSCITYVSELSGGNDSEFSVRVLDTLRSRQRT